MEYRLCLSIHWWMKFSGGWHLKLILYFECKMCRFHLVMKISRVTRRPLFLSCFNCSVVPSCVFVFFMKEFICNALNRALLNVMPMFYSIQTSENLHALIWLVNKLGNLNIICYTTHDFMVFHCLTKEYWI